MKILWKFTLRLGENALKKLYNRFKSIVLNRRKYLKINKNENNSKKNNIFNIVKFRSQLITMI